MLAVLTSASYDVAILPAFAKFYHGLGADCIFISVLELVPGLYEKTKEVSQSCPIPIHVRPASDRWRLTGLEAQNKSELRSVARLTQHDWYVPADLDEFINFDDMIPNVIAKLNAGGFGYAMGTFRDRFSPDGSLTEYDPSKSLLEQYPIITYVTRDIMGTNDRKVVLASGHLAVLSGHHYIADEYYKKYPKDFYIDHFAWRKGRLEAMKRRLNNYTKWKIDCSPLTRMIEYLSEKQ